ncbi:MAG: hypothetical protein ACE5F1_07800 [Planctomycetota bacterium]
MSKESFLALALGSLALATAAVMGTAEQGSPPEPEPERLPTPAHDEIADILAELERAWLPEQKQRALARARAQRGRMEAHLSWFLSRPTHPLLEEALQVAGELRLRSVLPHVLHLSLRQDLRPLALVAADRILPWPTETLAGFLREENVPVLLAAAEMAGRREDPPLDPLLRLLVHADPSVRRAALAALPAELPGQWLELLSDLVKGSEPDRAVFALCALGHTEITRSVEGFLAEQASGDDPGTCIAALKSLARKKRPLASAVAASLWRMIEEGTAQAPVLAHVFLCLERTGSIDVARVRKLLPGLDTYLEYFAARALVSVGEQQGLGVLLGILEEDSFVARGEHELREIRFAARSLLGSLSRTPASAGKETWLPWFRKHPLSGPVELPPPPLDFERK